MSESDLDKRRHAALELLRPVCIALMKDISKPNVRTLISSLPSVDAGILQEIQPYILFPIQHALHQRDISEALIGHLCEAVAAVFSKTQVMMVQVFFDVFNPLMFSLTSSNGASRVSTMSEDTKSEVVKAVSSLLQSSSEKVLEEYYSLKYLPVIGQLISLLLSLSEFEKSRGLQTAALDCLLVILQADTKYGKKNELKLGDLFAFCLPGVAMATCRIITGDPKQGHAVLSKAMRVWARVVTLVMSDDLLSKAQAQTVPKQPKVKDEMMEKLQALVVTRDDTWVKSTASKLHVLIGQICKLVSHSSWRVRLSLVEMTEEVLMSCSKALSESVPKLLEVLVGLINDEYGNVAKKAQNGLQTFSKSQSGTPGERAMIEILEENLHVLATSLPRQIKMCDEEEKPALISLLNGYITLLGPNISCVVNSSPHLHRLTLALIQALEMDVSDIKIVEERGSLLHHDAEVFTDSTALNIWRPRKYFKHFRDDSILFGLMSVCRQLGRFGNVYILVDRLLDVYQESLHYRLPAVLIINEIVVGAGTHEKKEEGEARVTNDSQLLNDVIGMLLDEYLSSANLRLVDSFDSGNSLSNSSSSSSSSPTSASSLSPSLVIMKPSQSMEAQRNLINRNRSILLMCLFMEGVAKFASVLGKAFQVHLIQALYPLVENLGHENVHISSTAYSALVEMAVACSYRSLDSLIQDNADYLVSSVSLRLRHFEKNRRSPQTLCVMLRYCSCDLLPLVDHSITQLLDSLDENYVEDLVVFMPVLLELTSAIGRWFPSCRHDQKQNSDKPSSVNSSNISTPDVVSFITEYVRNKEIAEGDFTDDTVNSKDQEHLTSGEGKKTERMMEDIETDVKKLLDERKKKRDKEEENITDNDDDEKTKESPKHIQVVKEVIQRIKHLLSSHDPRLQVQAMDVVCQSCLCLRDHQRELLPQIHQLWSGFHPLFRSQEKFIVIKALKTLLIMSEVSGDFIRQRTMKDVMPGLISYMEKQARISSGSRSAYLHTGHYKLQLRILSTLGSLATNLGLDSNHLDKVAQCCLPYLSDLQPAELQKACTEAFAVFISLDPDAMWLMLCQSYCPLELKEPGQEFVPIKFSPDPDKGNSFRNNVTELFRLCYT